MTSKQRLLTAASFQEPDRVPIELRIGDKARQLPETRKIVEFIDSTADNFLGAHGADWGFFGLSSEYSYEVIEDVPNEFRRIRRMQKTSAGDFHAIDKDMLRKIIENVEVYIEAGMEFGTYPIRA